MMLHLKAINKQQELRQFSCMLPELESGFELLNHIVASGDILISADLIEEGNRPTVLPVEVFDGISFLPILKQLEQDWTTSLAAPLRVSLPVDAVSNKWYREKLAYYEQCIIGLELIMGRVDRICQRASAYQTPQADQLVSYTQSILHCYESQLAKTNAIRNRLLAGFQSA
ncbi:hypothetical protein [Spirosoma gilvum]